jgi:hypothetical protein
VLILFKKRFLIAFALIVLKNSFFFQFILITLTSLFTLGYFLIYKPFSTTHINFMEFMNEITLLACLYTCLLFTDYEPGENAAAQIDKPQVGWFFITIVLTNLAINFCGILSVIAKFIIVLLRKAKAIYYILKRLWTEFTSLQERVVEIRPEAIESSDASAVYVTHP